MSSNIRKLSSSKRLLFQFVIILLACGLMEIASLVYLNSTYWDLLYQRRTIATSDPITRGTPFNYPMMIHPYLGMVFQPREADLDENNHGVRLTEYGFRDTQPPLRKRGPDRLIVALMGGSVARQLSFSASNILEREFSKMPGVHGKKIDFVRLAIDGNKQPQQLMALNYLLMLGGEFDLVINLDGVNEIALPSMDNVPFGVAAAFPRNWGQITAAAASRELMRTIGYQTYLRSSQQDLALWFENGIFRYSPTGCLIWRARNLRIDNLLSNQYRRINQLKNRELSICSSGPRGRFDSRQELYAHCAEIWARSSELMHDICQANGIYYFHFLQPNQYLTGSKPIGPQESVYAIDATGPFAAPVRDGYPIMRGMATRLQAAGVDFTDLTQIFADISDPVYKDNCCHFTDEGDRIIAEAISDRIKKFYEANVVNRLPGNE